jgi:hypothetical protein
LVWSIIALFIASSIWGILNILGGTFFDEEGTLNKNNGTLMNGIGKFN